jgi:hypothetical protein
MLSMIAFIAIRRAFLSEQNRFQSRLIHLIDMKETASRDKTPYRVLIAHLYAKHAAMFDLKTGGEECP